jgi:hypothetical protein
LSLIISSFIIIFSSCNILNNNEQNIPNIVWNIYSINIDGSNQKELIGNVGGSSLAGNNIIYDYISSMNIDGSSQHNILPANLDPINFSVSQDGTKIVFFPTKFCI